MKPKKRWTKEQRQEAQFRELVNVHKDSLKVLVKDPGKLKLLKKIARGEP